METGIERLSSAARAHDKVQTGLTLVDTLLKLGEGVGLPLLPAVCMAARGVLQVVQKSRAVINDALSAAQRTIDVLDLLQLMAKNVNRMDVASRASVKDRMSELQQLLDDVRSAVTAFGKKGWLRRALKVKRRTAFSQLDTEITEQLKMLLKFYDLARDAHIIDRLQPREYAVEAEVQRQVAAREAMGEAVDEDALEKDSEVVRGIAVASGVSDAEFQEELSGLRSEMREGFASTSVKLDVHGLKLDEIKRMMAALATETDRRSRMSLYVYDRKPDAPPGQKDKLAARLGKGSFGVTYRMRKVAGIDARLYAVKQIESEELDGAVLEKEARLLSMIKHENILHFYDAFWHDDDDGRLFVIVTELLTGGSLAEKISAAPPLQPPEVATLMRQVASGLAYMHSLNLQHRDLKPANVMLDPTGCAKIIDFGLARTSSAALSLAATKVGTNAYMSPEKTAEKRYGPADDVWAAGCILAELLLGRTIGNVALDAAKRQRAITESKVVSEPLGSWVEGCLQESAARRPAAAELEQGLASGGPCVHEAEECSRREAVAFRGRMYDEWSPGHPMPADLPDRSIAKLHTPSTPPASPSVFSTRSTEVSLHSPSHRLSGGKEGDDAPLPRRVSLPRRIWHRFLLHALAWLPVTPVPWYGFYGAMDLDDFVLITYGWLGVSVGVLWLAGALPHRDDSKDWISLSGLYLLFGSCVAFWFRDLDWAAALSIPLALVLLHAVLQVRPGLWSTARHFRAFGLVPAVIIFLAYLLDLYDTPRFRGVSVRELNHTLMSVDNSNAEFTFTDGFINPGARHVQHGRFDVVPVFPHAQCVDASGRAHCDVSFMLLFDSGWLGSAESKELVRRVNDKVEPLQVFADPVFRLRGSTHRCRECTNTPPEAYADCMALMRLRDLGPVDVCRRQFFFLGGLENNMRRQGVVLLILLGAQAALWIAALGCQLLQDHRKALV